MTCGNVGRFDAIRTFVLIGLLALGLVARVAVPAFLAPVSAQTGAWTRSVEHGRSGLGGSRSHRWEWQLGGALG